MKKHSKLLNALFTTLSALIVFSLISLFLYQFDNKYTQKTPQPIGGSLSLKASALEENPRFFLTRGWAFYPNKLLKPDDFKGDDFSPFMQFITIGSFNDFGLGHETQDATESATYRLILHLPDSPRLYSIALPEIFSAYDFYINDTLYASSGNTDPSHYQAFVGNRIVSFEADGTTVLLLSVTNKSHFYSGLIYPPLFGAPEAVQQLLSLKLLLRSAAMTLLLLCALISFYFAIRLHEKRGFLFTAICLCVALYTAYPIVFTFFTLPVQPWYSLEILCLYSVYFFSVLLQNTLCAIPKKVGHTTLAVLLTFCLLALLYSLPAASPFFPSSLFVLITRCIKLLTALYLIGTSFWAILQEGEYSRVLFIGTTLFGASLAFDRLLPLYEPILGGWFPEYGGYFLVSAFGYVLLREMLEAYRYRLRFEEEKRQLTSQVLIQKAHYQSLTEKIDTVIRIQHDTRHHFRILSTLAKQEDISSLRDYLKTLTAEAESTERTILCDNMVVDAILQYYKALCQKQGIAFSAALELPKTLPMSDTDLSILFSNLMENAFEACKSQGSPEPFIRVAGRFQQNQLLLRIENSFDTPVKQKRGRFLSARHSGFGLGTASAQSVVKGYDGVITFKFDRHFFQASLLISFIA